MLRGWRRFRSTRCGPIADKSCSWRLALANQWTAPFVRRPATDSPPRLEEDLMRKLTTWTAAALVLAASAVAAMAQTQSLGAARLHAQIQNATPIVKDVACRG